MRIVLSRIVALVSKTLHLEAQILSPRSFFSSHATQLHPSIKAKINSFDQFELSFHESNPQDCSSTMKRFFQKLKLSRKSKKNAPSHEKYEMQAMPSGPAATSQSPSTTPPSPRQVLTPSSSGRSMVTAAESPSRYRDDTVRSLDSWVTASSGAHPQLDTTASAMALHVQQASIPASSNADRNTNQTEPGAFGSASTGQAVESSNQPEPGSSQVRVSTSSHDGGEQIRSSTFGAVRSPEPTYRHGSLANEDDDSDEDPASCHVEYAEDLQPAEGNPSTGPGQPSHPAGLEVLLGVDPDMMHDQPQASPVGLAITSSPPSQTSADDCDDTSSDEPSSHSSEEFEGIANNTPADNDGWMNPRPLELWVINRELNDVARSRNPWLTASDVGLSLSSPIPWDTRMRWYRFRKPAGRCSHDQLLRYFPDERGADRRCDLCHQPCRILYSCVSDTADFSGYDSDEEPVRDISILPHWVQKAVAAGEYTPEQVERLIDDKIVVITLAAREREVIAHHAQHLWDVWGSTDQWRAARARLGMEFVEPCRKMVCPRCWSDPYYLDRTWRGIDGLATEPYEEALPRIPEYLSRRVSDASVVQAMPRSRTH